MLCPNCNNEIDDSSNFCQFCGFNVEIIENQSSDVMYCYMCGRLLKSNSQFCNYCGTKVTQSSLENSLEDYLICAHSEFNLENYNDSLDLFFKAYDMDNINKEALLGIIESFFKLEEYGNVIQYSYKYLKIDEINEKVLNYKLISEIKIESFAAAKMTINELLDISKNDISLLLKKIGILQNLGEIDEIIHVYNQILKIDNKRDDIYFKKSKLLFEMAKYEDALKSIDFAINTRPLMEYKLFKNKIEKKFFNTISNKSLSDALTYFNEYNYIFADKIFSKYDDSLSLELRTICLYRLGRYEEALNVINQLLKISNDAKIIDLKAKIYLAMGNQFHSIELFKKAVKLDKKYITDLAFAYGIFGDIELSKKYYLQVDDDVSKCWLNYYNQSKDFIISKLQNDFFNYPHLICLKMNMYLKKAISFFNKNDLKYLEKYLRLSEKYLSKLEDFIDKYNLNNSFVAYNFVYIKKILKNYQYIDFEKLKHFDNKIFNKFLEILNTLLKYYDDVGLLLEVNTFLSNFYKSLAKLLIKNSKKESLRYFKKAALHVNNDGEIWLYIANLSDENQIVFYNKALFCFNKKLEESNDIKYLKLKGITLFYLNCKKSAINLLKNYLPKRYNEKNIIEYIKKSMKNYSG